MQGIKLKYKMHKKKNIHKSKPMQKNIHSDMDQSKGASWPVSCIKEEHKLKETKALVLSIKLFYKLSSEGSFYHLLSKLQI
jgi:hypothetical protein